MQIVDTLLSVSGSVGTWSDELGKRASSPEVAVGVRARMRIDLRSDQRDADTKLLLSLRLADVKSDCYYLALDNDYKKSTIPKLITFVSITVVETGGRVFLEADLPETALPGLLAAVNEEGKVTLLGEIGGYAEDKTPESADFVIQFELVIRNRIYLGEEVPPEVVADPKYLTAAEVLALVQSVVSPDKGDPGADGKDAYEVAVALGYQGTRAAWLASLKGADGKDAYEVAVALGYQGTRAAWLASLKGDPGLTAYDVALAQGFVGSVDDWLTSLKGSAGKDLAIDATGELSELAAFASEPLGFTFAATLTDAQAKTTKLYLFVKRSNDFNDWCNPAVITYYERSAEIKALAPVTFSAPPAGAEYFAVDLANYPHSTVAAVCVDTVEGELTLPYASSLGVRKMVKNSANRLLVYFGSQCPAFATGRLYLTQFLGAAATGDSGITAKPLYYGYIPSAVLGGVLSVTGVTLAMVNDARSEMVTATAATMDKTSLGVVPAGALVVVLVPTDAALRVQKFDGVGGWTLFWEDNGVPSSGANGNGLVLAESSCEVYGEFCLADAEIFIRVINKE